MFKVNDVIIYGTQGVCQITGIEEKNISGARKKYFVLKPVQDNGPTIFAPMDNALVRKKMRHLLTIDQVHSLIDAMPDENALWIKNDNERKELYRSILAKGDPVELIKMIKALYIHRQQRESEGKRLHMIDERFFKDAEQILYNEFQYVLQLNSKAELMTYILSRIQA